MSEDLSSTENFIHNKFGYCYYDLNSDNIKPIIFNLFIEPEYRCLGHARKLLLDVIEKIRDSGYLGQIDIEAEPREVVDLEKLTSFYKSLGINVL